jgi:threonine dehydratase
MSISIDDVRAAADAIAGHVVDTPCLHSRTLSHITGAQIFLKFENLQFTASFKERGALNKLLRLDEPLRRAGVIAASAGNHALGVAYHAQRLGVPAVIVMPRYAPGVKIEHTRDYGAEVILHGDLFDEARQHGRILAEHRGLTWIDGYDDAQIIAGQGTIAIEMLRAQPAIDVLVVPIGGGGLIAGIAVAARALKPGIEIIGVQSSRFPSMYAAVAGQAATFEASTIADGIAVKAPGTLTLPIVQHAVSEILLVDEEHLEQALVMLLDIEKTLAEGAGAASLAAVLAHGQRFLGRNVGLVLSGGNIDPLLLTRVIERGLVRTGRLTRLVVQMRDFPGALAEVTGCLADQSANIQEISHQRAFSSFPVQTVEVEFVLQTRNQDHVRQITEALARKGFHTTLRPA